MTLSLATRTALGLASLVIIIIISLVSEKPADVKILLILLGIGMFVTNIFGSFTAVLAGLEKFKEYGLISAAYSFAYSAVAIAALYLGYGLVGIGASQLAIATAIAVVGILFVSTKVMKPLANLSIQGCIELLKKAAPLGLAGILVMMYYRIGFILLSFIRGDVELGYYNSAFTIINGLLLFAGTFSGTLLPRLSSLYALNTDNLDKLFRTAFKYLFFLGFGFAFGAAILARPVFELLFGAEYLPGASTLVILGWASALMFINSLNNNMLIALDLKKKLLYINGVVAAANILLNVIFIPSLGFKGAAFATFGSELILSIWSCSVLNEHNPLLNFVSLIARTLVAALVMTVVISLLHFSVIVEIALGVAVYSLALIIVRGLDRSDLEIVMSLMGRRATDFKTAS